MNPLTFQPLTESCDPRTTFVYHIVCKKCNVILQPHTMVEHLDITHPVHCCATGHYRNPEDDVCGECSKTSEQCTCPAECDDCGKIHPFSECEEEEPPTCLCQDVWHTARCEPGTRDFENCQTKVTTTHWWMQNTYDDYKQYCGFIDRDERNDVAFKIAMEKYGLVDEDRDDFEYLMDEDFDYKMEQLKSRFPIAKFIEEIEPETIRKMIALP